MTRYIRRPSFLSVFMLLTAIILLPGCAPATFLNPFAYADAPFSLFVEGTYLPANDKEGTPRPFTAQITIGFPENGDPTLRGLTVVFTSPDSLEGLTVTSVLSPAADGTITRMVTLAYLSAYGDLQATTEGSEFDGYLRFAEAWLPIGEVTEVSPTVPDGSYTVTRRSGDREAVFVFSGEDLPASVRLTDGRGVVEMRIREKEEPGE